MKMLCARCAFQYGLKSWQYRRVPVALLAPVGGAVYAAPQDHLLLRRALRDWCPERAERVGEWEDDKRVELRADRRGSAPRVGTCCGWDTKGWKNGRSALHLQSKPTLSESVRPVLVRVGCPLIDVPLNARGAVRRVHELYGFAQ